MIKQKYIMEKQLLLYKPFYSIELDSNLNLKIIPELFQ